MLYSVEPKDLFRAAALNALLILHGKDDYSLSDIIEDAEAAAGEMMIMREVDKSAPAHN